MKKIQSRCFRWPDNKTLLRKTWNFLRANKDSLLCQNSHQPAVYSHDKTAAKTKIRGKETGAMPLLSQSMEKSPGHFHFA